MQLRWPAVTVSITDSGRVQPAFSPAACAVWASRLYLSVLLVEVQVKVFETQMKFVAR